MSELSASTWSETDASNTAAPPDGMPEQQFASTVNDTVRGLMGGLKRFWGRINGRYASGGAANAYTLTPDQALAAYVTGERYSFRASFANTGAATLAISGLAATAIKKYDATGKVALASGDIQNGQPVTVEYDGTDLVMVTPVAPTALADGQVTTAKLADASVTAAKAANGFVVNRAYAETATRITSNSAIPVDNSIPQLTEGVELITVVHTPNESTNRLRIRFNGYISNNVGADSVVVVALFRDSTANAKRAVPFTASNGQFVTLVLEFEEAAGSVSATTYKIRFGPSVVGGSGWAANGGAAANIFGGVDFCTLIIDEIAA